MSFPLHCAVRGQEMGRNPADEKGKGGGVSFPWVTLEAAWCFCPWPGLCNPDPSLEHHLNLGMKLELSQEGSNCLVSTTSSRHSMYFQPDSRRHLPDGPRRSGGKDALARGCVQDPLL